MNYLVDTNILLRYIDRSSGHHAIARSAIRTLRTTGCRLFATPQNFAEFWNVTTRPVAQNGLGRTPLQADRFLAFAERLCALLPDAAAAYAQWRRLVVQHQVAGVQVHDARLVASMIVHGIGHVLTFNASDFSRFAPEGIVAVDPADV